MREWLLGPLELEHTHLFPRGTKLSAILLRQGRLYLDFTSPILLRGTAAALSVREISDVLDRGIGFNFPRIKEVILSVEGEPLPPDSDAS